MRLSVRGVFCEGWFGRGAFCEASLVKGSLARVWLCQWEIRAVCELAAGEEGDQSYIHSI